MWYNSDGGGATNVMSSTKNGENMVITLHSLDPQGIEGILYDREWKIQNKPSPPPPQVPPKDDASSSISQHSPIPLRRPALAHINSRSSRDEIVTEEAYTF
jgi:hypothetical protein